MTNRRFLFIVSAVIVAGVGALIGNVSRNAFLQTARAAVAAAEGEALAAPS